MPVNNIQIYIVAPMLKGIKLSCSEPEQTGLLISKNFIVVERGIDDEDIGGCGVDVFFCVGRIVFSGFGLLLE